MRNPVYFTHKFNPDFFYFYCMIQSLCSWTTDWLWFTVIFLLTWNLNLPSVNGIFFWMQIQAVWVDGFTGALGCCGDWWWWFSRWHCALWALKSLGVYTSHGSGTLGWSGIERKRKNQSQLDLKRLSQMSSMTYTSFNWRALMLVSNWLCGFNFFFPNITV